MSALGLKRTWRLQFAMFALPSKADIGCCLSDVCFGPEADIVRADKESKRQFQSKSFCGLLVDYQLELCWLLNWQITWLGLDTIAASAGDDPPAREAPLGRVRTTCQLRCAAFGHRAPFPYR